MSKISQGIIHDVFMRMKLDDMNEYFQQNTFSEFWAFIRKDYAMMLSRQENSRRINPFCLLVVKRMSAMTAAQNTKHSSSVSGKTLIFTAGTILKLCSSTLALFWFAPIFVRYQHYCNFQISARWPRNHTQGGAMPHKSKSRSMLRPPAPNLSHCSSHNYLTDRKVGGARRRIELEMQQSIKGTTGRWLSGARTDVGIEQCWMGPCYVTGLTHAHLYGCCGCLGWHIYLCDSFLNFIFSWTKNPLVLCVKQSRPIAVLLLLAQVQTNSCCLNGYANRDYLNALTLLQGELLLLLLWKIANQYWLMVDIWKQWGR